MKKKRKIFFYCILASISTLIFFTDCSHKIKGSGTSESVGEVNNGSLVNGRKFPFRGTNYKYYSRVSYAVFNRAWVHEKVLKTCIDAYETCQTTCPNHKFLLMECSCKHGGKMWPHRTHQNGTSVDFGTPLLKNGEAYFFHNHYGLAHYAMKFDENGISQANKKISIDFETMGKHILALHEAAKKNGLSIKKVIFKIDLKDNFLASENGKKVAKKGIYFAQSLPKIIDEQHDEHYHIDFGFL
jgi:penicillin-insensitive murein endopeptidase